ncbi:MAG: hypothetical protein JWM11_4775 [Planctomycetaceae bacterium]|nr:hypothetical protein [Planctomycetaceae bacterium]
MIRLAVNGDYALWQQVKCRLREPVVVTLFDVSKPNPREFEYCDAVLFVQPIGFDVSLEEVLPLLNKHVLVIAGSWHSFDNFTYWTDAANRYGFPLSVVNLDHFLPSRQTIHEQLRTRKLGEPGLVRMHRWKNRDEETGNWNQRYQLPVPLVLDLELAHWLTGMSPNLVFATEASGAETDALPGRTIQVHLGYENGGMALIGYSDAFPCGAGYQSLSIIGCSGAVYADDHQNMQLLYQWNCLNALRTEEGVRPRANLAQVFVDALCNDLDLSPSVTDWQNILKLKNAAEKSLASRQAVSLEVS